MEKDKIVKILKLVEKNHKDLKDTFIKDSPNQVSYKYLHEFCEDLIYAINNDCEEIIISGKWV